MLRSQALQSSRWGNDLQKTPQYSGNWSVYKNSIKSITASKLLIFQVKWASSFCMTNNQLWDWWKAFPTSNGVRSRWLLWFLCPFISPSSWMAPHTSLFWDPSQRSSLSGKYSIIDSHIIAYSVINVKTTPPPPLPFLCSLCQSYNQSE